MKSVDRIDVLRSLKRYMSLVLVDPAWDLRIGRSDSATRPSGVIVATPVTTTTGSAYVHHHARTYDVFLYPPLVTNADGTEELPGEAHLRAEQLAAEVETRVLKGFKNVEGKWLARTLRMPVYDYTGLGANKPVTPERFVSYQPIDREFSVEVRPDPEDERLFTLICHFRLLWSTDGDLSRNDGALLQDVHLGFQTD